MKPFKTQTTYECLVVKDFCIYLRASFANNYCTSHLLLHLKSKDALTVHNIIFLCDYNRP